MKKEIPESWQRFHELVIMYRNGSIYTLTDLYSMANCSARQPRIYKELGWIKVQHSKLWRYTGPMPPDRKLSEYMAQEIRAKSAELEKASDPLGIKAISKPSQESRKVDFSKGDEMIYRTIGSATDEELVHELRRRGYEVTARKIVEL
jgi:hypothetical protein